MTDQKTRPISFKAEMVRAILARGKTQTRRIVKLRDSMGYPHPEAVSARFMEGAGWEWWGPLDTDGRGLLYQHSVACPYGVPGSRLWVKEPYYYSIEHDNFYWAADRQGMGNEAYRLLKPRNRKGDRPMFLPRVLSRITLEVTGVRVERLQDITEADAVAEGSAAWSHFEDAKAGHPLTPYRTSFAWAWNQINGRDAWLANPWLWVVEFRVL